MFLKNPENIAVILNVLTEVQRHVKRATVKLLYLMLQNCQEMVQESFLNTPEAITRVMNLLATSDDQSPFDKAIRNEALLVVIGLCKDNKAIQQMAAFNQACDRFPLCFPMISHAVLLMNIYSPIAVFVVVVAGWELPIFLRRAPMLETLFCSLA
jgi:hypothetical protein